MLGVTKKQPKVSVHAKELDPDRPVWERQPEEPDVAWAAFHEYLMSEDRVVSRHHENRSTAHYFAARWSWAVRAYEWDNYIVGQELQMQLRARVTMNTRHRRVARDAVGKVTEWLDSFDPKKMTPTEATKLLDVATRLEREANGGTSAIPAGLERPGTESDAPHEQTFEQRVAGAGGDLGIELRDLAKMLHKKIPNLPQ